MMADLVVAPSSPDDRNADGITLIIEPAPRNDVLIDQLEYLVSHTGPECPLGCPDCDRLGQIKKLLLVFQSRNAPEAPESVAA
jgi:hypothetical protein